MSNETPRRILDEIIGPRNGINTFNPVLITPAGEATFIAIKKAVDDLVGAAPKDHDVLVHAFNIWVDKIGFIDPHTLLFSGCDQEGNHTSVVAHFSQVVARVIYVRKKEPFKDRVVTGFWSSKDEAGT